MLSLYDLAEVVAAFAAFFSLLFVLVRRPRHVSAVLFIFATLLTLLFWSAFVALIPGSLPAVWQEGILVALFSLASALWLLFLLGFARETPNASPRFWSLPVRFVIILLLAASVAGFFLRFFHLDHLESGEAVLVIERAGHYLLGLIIVAATFAVLQLENTFRASTGGMRRALAVPAISFAALLVTVIVSASLGLLFGIVRFSGIQVSAALTTVMLILVSRFLVFEERSHQRVVLSRQAVYSSVGVILVGAYLVIVAIAVWLLASLGGSPKVFFSVVAAFAVVVAFLGLLLSGSVKARLRGLVDKTFLSGKVDLSAELASYADDVTARVDKQEMFQITAKVLAEKCGLAEIEIFERTERASHFIAVYPAERNDSHTLPGVENWLLRSTRLSAANDVAMSLSESDTREREFLESWRDGVLVPLLARRELVGFVAALSPGRLSSDATLLVETISHQLALSLISARQYDRLVETKELASFHKVSSFVIHDVKNLISMVSMILQNAEKKFDDPRFQQTTIETLSGAQNRMQRMIGRLSAPQEQVDFPIGDCQIGQIVLDLVEEMRLGANPKLDLSVAVERLPKVRGNPEKIKSIIGNLLINAIEAMPNGGQLKISADEDNESVSVSVADSGVGMSVDFMREKLFRPFRTSKKNGLGIGLFQSREVARQMGGELSATSEVGQGSVFTLRLEKQ